MVNAFAELDLVKAWGDGARWPPTAPRWTPTSTTCSPRPRSGTAGTGGIAYHHISDTYIALFSQFIPCGVWEAVYIIEGLLEQASEVQPDTVHADTQGQSLPVFALAHLLGFDLMPRIRNWKDLTSTGPARHTATGTSTPCSASRPQRHRLGADRDATGRT